MANSQKEKIWAIVSKEKFDSFPIWVHLSSSLGVRKGGELGLKIVESVLNMIETREEPNENRKDQL